MLKRVFVFGVLLLGGSLFGDVALTDVTARASVPWDGTVTLSYAVSGDLAAAFASSGFTFAPRIMATDRATGMDYVATVLTGDATLTEGVHGEIVWDMAAQGIDFSSTDVVFTVSCVAAPSPYCVVDLSGGTTAENYPVSYLGTVPDGGWTDVDKTTNLVLRYIAPGAFTMGDVHGVHGGAAFSGITLTNAYYIGVFETTQRQWELVTGTRPSHFTNAIHAATRPVEKVKYTDIRGTSAGVKWPDSRAVDPTSFLGLLRTRTQIDAFDLPSEAQWEYACRAGTETDFANGKNWSLDQFVSPLDELGRYFLTVGEEEKPARDCDTSSGTAPVGSSAPNDWGLYDMHGNVREWCLDVYDTLKAGSVEPVGKGSGSQRVVRGGGWKDYQEGCTSYARDYLRQTWGYEDNGFRVARVVAPPTGLPSGVSPAISVNVAPPPAPVSPVQAVVGLYGRWTLEELDALPELPAGAVVSGVKAEGLPKGLKVVGTKDKTAWWIDGVPMEAVDYEARPMFAKITVQSGKTKTEIVRRMFFEVREAEVGAFACGVVGADYAEVSVRDVWPEADVNWSFKGWPAGVKYAAKDVKATNTVPAHPQFSVYGLPTKAGVFTVTATAKGVNAEGKAIVETRWATFTVWGADGERDFRYVDQAYVATETKVLDADVKSVAGLPTGLKFTTKPVAADEKKGTPAYAAQSVYGTPTKPGVYAVTFAKADKSKETFLWKVTPGENGGTCAGIGWDSGTVVDGEAKTVTVVQGVQCAWELNGADAKMSAKGLPSGLKLVQDKSTKAYTVSGVPTKPGTTVATLTTERNGVKVDERFAVAVEALPAWAAGTFAAGSARLDGQPGTVTLTTGTNGKISGKYVVAGANGKSVTAAFATNGFAAVERDEDGVVNRLVAAVDVKVGKESVARTLEIRPAEFAEGAARGVATLAGGEDPAAELAQDLWSSKVHPLPTVGKVTIVVDADGDPFILKGCGLAFKFAAKGKVTVTATQIGATKSAGSASATVALLRAEPTEGGMKYEGTFSFVIPAVDGLAADCRVVFTQSASTSTPASIAVEI